MQREGIFREMKRRRLYEKPPEQAAREKTRRCAGSLRPLARGQFSRPRARIRVTAPTASPNPLARSRKILPCRFTFTVSINSQSAHSDAV